jgi:hypothetical protein
MAIIEKVIELAVVKKIGAATLQKWQLKKYVSI